jgi:deoxyribose-phosphate aldolase
MIDHTMLKADATRNQIRTLCKEGKKYGFAAVCVNSCWVPFCSHELDNTDVKVCSVVGFPLGAADTSVKAFEAKKAVENGASEIDMVLNVGMFLSKRPADVDYVKKDIRAVVAAASPAIVKVILETGLLTDEQIVTACILAQKAGAHYVKTSTGFGPPFELDHIVLMRKTVDVGIKAAGGIKTYQDAVAVINAGATRIGASAGVTIVEGAL